MQRLVVAQLGRSRRRLPRPRPSRTRTETYQTQKPKTRRRAETLRHQKTKTCTSEETLRDQKPKTPHQSRKLSAPEAPMRVLAFKASERRNSPAAGSGVRNERSCRRSGAAPCCAAVGTFCPPPAARPKYFDSVRPSRALRHNDQAHPPPKAQ